MPDRDDIPLMFQAQVLGRSQIQKLENLKKTRQPQQQAYDWVGQWQKACDADNVPTFDKLIQNREYTFTWRDDFMNSKVLICANPNQFCFVINL